MFGGMAFLQWKLDRAETHLNVIEREHERLINGGLYTISKRDNSQKQRHIIRYEAIANPPELSLSVGEFAYSLRSGLDQLAWRLALVNLKTKRPRSQTCFPIFGEPPKKGFGDRTKDILPAAFTVIESLQPYHRGNGYKRDMLWILNELCITDKHVIAPVNSMDARFRILGTDDWRRKDSDYAFEISVPLTDKFKVKIYQERADIVLGEPIGNLSSGFGVRVAELRPIYDFVRNDIAPRFAGFFK